jgi:hypothetical protein
MYNQKLRNRLKNKKIIEEDEEIEEEDIIEYINENPYEGEEIYQSYIPSHKQEEDDCLNENKKLPGKYKLKKHLNKFKNNSDKYENNKVCKSKKEKDELYKQEAEYYDDISLGNEYDPDFEDLYDEQIDNIDGNVNRGGEFNEFSECVYDNLYLDNYIEDFENDRESAIFNPLDKPNLRNNLI